MADKQQDPNIAEIESFFAVPDRVADKLQNVVEKVRGGYVLITIRPRWDGSPGPWTRSLVAKVIFHRPSQSWRVYWMRASGRWFFYNQYKTLNRVMKAIKEDRHGCFWG